jgi:hypothetical protein
MRAITVHPIDSRADAASITDALTQAQDGDIVLIGPGLYSPTRTGETLPLRVSPGVMVAGVGRSDCIIDGEGQFEPSFNPIRPDWSVMVLENNTSLSGIAITNGGGHGVGVPSGASVTIRNCVFSRHGDHGVFLCGVTEAVVADCIFQDNGLKRFEPSLPRGVGARQGHHIFAEAQHGQRNRLFILDNTMRNCFADGLAFICFFPQPDGVTFDATVLRNTIEASERGGLLFSCSFGPSYNRLRLFAAGNTLKGNKQFGLSLLTTVPLADKVPQNGMATALVSENEITASPVGVLIQGAVSEAHRNTCHVTIDRNRIAECGKSAIRLLGALGGEGVETTENSLYAIVSRNQISGETQTIAIQGAGGAGNPQRNTVHVRLFDNIITPPSARTIVVSDGRTGNQVEVAAGTQDYTRTTEDLLK